MAGNLLTEVDGWTPLIDDLTKELGLVTSAVFGRIWRFCQGADRVCSASLETIASDLHLDKATVMRHAKKLCENGYLKDLTPDLRNVPHVYADTGKIKIFAKIGVVHNNTDESVADNNNVLQPATQSVAESQLKKVLKIEKDSPEEYFKNRIRMAMAAGELEHHQLETRIFNCFHVNYDWRLKSNKPILLWLKQRPKQETIEQFAKWWYSRDWRGRNNQPPTAKQIKEMWPQAFQPELAGVEYYYEEHA